MTWNDILDKNQPFNGEVLNIKGVDVDIQWTYKKYPDRNYVYDIDDIRGIFQKLIDNNEGNIVYPHNVDLDNELFEIN